MILGANNAFINVQQAVLLLNVVCGLQDFCVPLSSAKLYFDWLIFSFIRYIPDVQQINYAELQRFFFKRSPVIITFLLCAELQLE